jgi:hypothetical protein
MELDIRALEQLPEVAEPTGLDELDRSCPKGKATRIICVAPSCVRTDVIVTSPVKS